ncbi:MAG: carboxy terminal-processing peptidase [Lentimicrobiaceae bacterium]|nr:carboxy terminal-processing peptidase [Lentimicrobiaceae bacterium]
MRRYAIYVILSMAGILLLAAWKPTDPVTRDRVLMNLVTNSLNNLHYNPKELNDSLSAQVFDLYLKRLDISKRFLLQEDANALSAFRYSIDDAFQDGSMTFFELSNEIITRRIDEAQQYANEILAQPFDFSKEAFIETDADKLDYAATPDELKERWQLNLKFQTLSRLSGKMEEQEKAIEKGDTTFTQKTFAEWEVWARENVAKRNKDWLTRLQKTERKERFDMFLNAFINVFDPHSGYYPPKAKEDFDIRFSGQLEGIGATLEQEDGYIKVNRIVPGSASARQGELEVGDLIVKVAQDGEEPVDVVDMRLDDAVRLIRGPKGTTVHLTVRKIDGSLTIISIVREVVVLEETFAKSAILQEEGSKRRIGYIKLPSFYMDFNDSQGRSSAKDVLAELNKLQEEGIDGLVFDLRDNGGGSLMDAVAIAGYFIEKGPVVQVKSRMGAPSVFDDKDAKVQYAGPLVVMVNSFSASASEIFAAAMQDYGRALIIGSATTFGKGTVQRFFELDRMVPQENEDIKPLGSIKLTTQKFYRINGNTTQLQGLTPDIILPDRFAYVDIGEKERDYPMPWNIIDPATYQPWTSSTLDMKAIRQYQNRRMTSDTTFQLLQDQARQLKSQRDATYYPLEWQAYLDFEALRKAENKRFESLGKNALDIMASYPKADQILLEADTVKRATMEKWHEQLRKDRHLFEAVNILSTPKLVRVN